jgi:hypothetical protein
MPTLEYLDPVPATRTETVVSTARKGWQRQVARLMRRRRRFILETSCPRFDPSGLTGPSAWSWVRGERAAIAGCGLPGSLGLILLGLSLLDPQPSHRLALAGLGIGSVVMLARVLIPILTGLGAYHWRVSFNPQTGKYAWIGEPDPYR